MIQSKQKLVLAMGIALTFAMLQTSDAQLLRSRRCTCPPPTTNYCCVQDEVQAAPAVECPEVVEEVVVEEVFQSATPVIVETPVATTTFAPIETANTLPVLMLNESQPLVLESPVSQPVGSPIVFESTPTPIEASSDQAGVVVHDTASDVPVVQTETSVVVPSAATEEITLTSTPTPTPVPTPDASSVPVPVATGDTVIKSAPKPMATIDPPTVPDATPAKAVDAAVEAVDKSILKGE